MSELTKRQRTILKQLLAGRSVEEIAGALECSPWTVRAHVKAIAAKIERPELKPMRRILLFGAELLQAA